MNITRLLLAAILATLAQAGHAQTVLKMAHVYVPGNIWFETAAAKRDPALNRLRDDPRLDALRGDPRYLALLAKGMGTLKPVRKKEE